MTRKPKTAKAAAVTGRTRPAVDLDAERKSAIDNLRAMRAQGAKNLNMGAKVVDFREHVDTPAMGCGVASYILRALQNPSVRAEIVAEGEQIFAKITGAPRRSSGETILYLDPTRAGPVAMALAGAGLRAAGKRAGWATYRGMVEAQALHAILADLGLDATDYRLDELPGFIPQGTDPDKGLTEPGPASMRPSEATQAQTVPDPEVEGSADLTEPEVIEPPVTTDPEQAERDPLPTPVPEGLDPVEPFAAPDVAADDVPSVGDRFDPGVLADAAAEMSRLLYRDAIPVTPPPSALPPREARDRPPGRHAVDASMATDREEAAVD